MYAILGIDPVGELDEDVLEYVHPDDRDEVVALHRRTVEEGVPFEVEQRIVRPDGTVRHLLVRGEPILDGGLVVGMRGVSQDITDQREAEATLEATERELYRSELTQLRDRHRVDTLQEAMLPSELADVPWLELDACYTPATPDMAVGGDWYDVFVVDQCRVAFTVGDVSGHGVEAAALMAQLRNGLRAYAAEDPAPATVMNRLNRLLWTLEVDSFATAVFGLAAPDEFTVAVAGHPSPVVFGSGPARLLEPAGGPLLGVSAEQDYREVRQSVGPGTGLLVYTDGLVERRGEHIDDGLARLVAAVAVRADRPLDGLCQELVRELVPAHVARDDVCQVLLRVRDERQDEREAGGLTGG